MTHSGEAPGGDRRFRYEPGERPKRRHHWSNDYPGFVKVRGAPVGKCPSDISMERAEELLNAGIPYEPDQPEGGVATGWPGRVYVVHNGAIYRATLTSPGVYHAFPELPARLRELPRRFREKLLARARELGCERETRRWMESSP